MQVNLNQARSITRLFHSDVPQNVKDSVSAFRNDREDHDVDLRLPAIILEKFTARVNQAFKLLPAEIQAEMVKLMEHDGTMDTYRNIWTKERMHEVATIFNDIFKQIQ